jgi:hypothetical protein
MPAPSTPGYLTRRPPSAQNRPSGRREGPNPPQLTPLPLAKRLGLVLLAAAFWLALATVCLADGPPTTRPARSEYTHPAHTRDHTIELRYRQPPDPENPVLGAFGLSKREAWLELIAVLVAAVATGAWVSRK